MNGAESTETCLALALAFAGGAANRELHELPPGFGDRLSALGALLVQSERPPETECRLVAATGVKEMLLYLEVGGVKRRKRRYVSQVSMKGDATERLNRGSDNVVDEWGHFILSPFPYWKGSIYSISHN